MKINKLKINRNKKNSKLGCWDPKQMFHPIIKLGVGFLHLIAECGWVLDVQVLQSFLACEYNCLSFAPATTCERTERRLLPVKLFPVKPCTAEKFSGMFIVLWMRIKFLRIKQFPALTKATSLFFSTLWVGNVPKRE